MEEIAAALATFGCKSWVDSLELRPYPDVNWYNACDDALKASAGTVGILSMYSLRLQRLHREWNWSLANDRPILFISLLSTDDERFIPYGFRDINLNRYMEMSQTLSAIRSRFSSLQDGGI